MNYIQNCMEKLGISPVDIKQFISRFGDNNWTNGNCYWFAVILKERFGGEIYYELYNGHFITKIGDRYYDYNGEYCIKYLENELVPWDNFKEYDELQYERIIRDCIK